MVVEGSHDLVASRREEVDAAIDTAQLQANHVPVILDRKDGSLALSIGATPKGAIPATASILLMAYDPEASVRIRSGENSGREIRYRNIVRSTRTLGSWSGSALKLDAALDAGEVDRPLAVVIQEDGGRVWGLAASNKPGT